MVLVRDAKKDFRGKLLSRLGKDLPGGETDS